MADSAAEQMTVRDLINALLDHPLDSVPYVGKGIGPLASLSDDGTCVRPFVVLSPGTDDSPTLMQVRGDLERQQDLVAELRRRLRVGDRAQAQIAAVKKVVDEHAGGTGLGNAIREAMFRASAEQAEADLKRGVVPSGTYAGGGRSPVAQVWLCAPCAGYAPLTDPDYSGALSGRCQGCGSESREIHRFPALIESADGCSCSGAHFRASGDLHARDALDV